MPHKTKEQALACSSLDAAFLNGTAAHALDFDDVSWTTIGHPTVGIAPTALSLAVAQGLSGREFLAAYVVGAECAH